MTRLAALATVLALGAVVASPARAQCVLDGVTSAAFGSYDVLSPSPLDTVASVTYKCLVSLSVTIDLSTGTSGTYASRTLTRTGGGGTLTYNLYFDAAHQTIWGNGAGGTVHYGPFLGVLSDVVLPVFGRIPAGQDIQVGSYSDVIVVTLNY